MPGQARHDEEALAASDQCKSLEISISVLKSGHSPSTEQIKTPLPEITLAYLNLAL